MTIVDVVTSAKELLWLLSLKLDASGSLKHLQIAIFQNDNVRVDPHQGKDRVQVVGDAVIQKKPAAASGPRRIMPSPLRATRKR